MKKVKKVTKKRLENDNSLCETSCKCSSGHSGCLYGLGFLGSAIYYVSTATSFGAGIVGILKSIVWPAFLIFELMKFLGM